MSLNKPNKIQIIKYAPPPPDLPTLGKADPSEVVFIGRTNYVAALEEKKFVFGIKRVDRRRHMYIIGKSGVGKSKLQELMIRQDIAYGHGVCIIDPHGELVHDILDFIPKERVDDVCIVDPDDVAYPVSFNPLADINPTFKHQLTHGFIEVLRKQFGSNWTPRLEHIFRFTLLALMDYKEATMQGMILMLTDSAYRDKVIENIKDDMVHKFWSVEFEHWALKFDTDTIIPLVNKLGQFLSDPMLRNIFGQQKNKINIEQLMNDKKILLINLSKGKIGEENSSLFGSIFLTKIKQAGMERVIHGAKESNDFYLYIDEFHNIITDTFENLLSEARKYGINLIVSHQYIGQLLPKLQQAVLGNISTIVSFRVGGDDATKLKPEFAPVFDVKDMINLGVGEFYIKMTIDGESYDPFSAETLRVLEPTHVSYRSEIIEASRRKYAIPMEDAIKLIKE
ncbi:MAG: type IV secretion system DNA-binding domain-containing protein [Candidatus Nomurabacteria bacterium]|nr:type IV secretion system DNA-binding domain-containing protein [Candidatus Nomurabacteria bacterium]